jgi:hypothetical protein
MGGCGGHTLTPTSSKTTASKPPLSPNRPISHCFTISPSTSSSAPASAVSFAVPAALPSSLPSVVAGPVVAVVAAAAVAGCGVQGTEDVKSKSGAVSPDATCRSWATRSSSTSSSCWTFRAGRITPLLCSPIGSAGLAYGAFPRFSSYNCTRRRYSIGCRGNL